MTRIAFPLVLVSLFLASAAQSQTFSRTWVSGVGDDNSLSCSRTAPCKTFNGALQKTTAGGEIDAMDPGPYGTTNVTKAVTIDGGGFVASVIASGTNGITINAGTTDVVVIRNVQVMGAGSGIAGVKIVGAKAIVLDNMRITGMGSGNARGIDVQNVGLCHITIRNTHVEGNTGIGAVFQGVFANTVVADISHSSFTNNGSHGIYATNGARVALHDVVSSENAIAGLIVDGTGTNVSVLGSSFTNNTNSGVQAGTGTAVTATIALSKSAITGNSPGVQISGGVVQTHQDNAILGNNVDVAGGSLSPVSQQ
jgi:hypothetical protein